MRLFGYFDPALGAPTWGPAGARLLGALILLTPMNMCITVLILDALPNRLWATIIALTVVCIFLCSCILATRLLNSWGKRASLIQELDNKQMKPLEGLPDMLQVALRSISAQFFVICQGLYILIVLHMYHGTPLSGWPTPFYYILPSMPVTVVVTVALWAIPVVLYLRKNVLLFQYQRNAVKGVPLLLRLATIYRQIARGCLALAVLATIGLALIQHPHHLSQYLAANAAVLLLLFYGITPFARKFLLNQRGMQRFNLR